MSSKYFFFRIQLKKHFSIKFTADNRKQSLYSFFASTFVLDASKPSTTYNSKKEKIMINVRFAAHLRVKGETAMEIELKYYVVYGCIAEGVRKLFFFFFSIMVVYDRCLDISLALLSNSIFNITLNE
jgi:hypothetical protein